jgi:membrane fusion protein, heavy metal efflux system
MLRRYAGSVGCGALLVTGSLAIGACGHHEAPDPSAGAPPPAVVERDDTGDTVHVDHPEQYPLVTATSQLDTPELSATGSVTPDVSRNVSVVSMASGRVVDLRAKLGDNVVKGQLLLRIQSSDIASAMSDYRHAVADEVLAKKQLDRSKDLYDHQAIPLSALEVAQNAEDKAQVDVQTSLDALHVLGGSPDMPQSGIVDVVAPVSGVITDQTVTNAAGVKSLDNQSDLFTISDLSHVWILCDVYENDLAAIHEGNPADIHLAAYPDKVLKGRIDNIGAILDPNLRTAKVRVDVENPGLLRVGMFVTATFHAQAPVQRTVVPASAILHLHDRDWVYLAAGAGKFERRAVTGGKSLPGNMQEVVTGLQPGERVVLNALALESTVDQ